MLALMMQNTSHAVMAQRVEPKDSADDFPTPPWATRALAEHVLDGKVALRSMSCLEPACGAGHMAKVLKEYSARSMPSPTLSHAGHVRAAGSENRGVPRCNGPGRCGVWGLHAPARCATAPCGATGRTEGSRLKITLVRRNRAGQGG